MRPVGKGAAAACGCLFRVPADRAHFFSSKMKHEIVALPAWQLIGISKEIAFNEAEQACPAFWGYYFENLIRPIVMEGKEPTPQQAAALAHGVGEYGYCLCDQENHCCDTCGERNFTPCNARKFTYVIGGRYQGGEVPEGLALYPIAARRWLKVQFEGGLPAFAAQRAKLYGEWLPQHPEFVWDGYTACLEWYSQGDVASPDYAYGLMLPLV